MGIIKKLSVEVSNQIAAGEVVERPASVVKELVENSIDAGATVVTVRIERGGISRIQVTDDGSGMSKDDAIACFDRHATSKIETAKDLESIYTMGFRGEALSSISSISQVDLYTKRPSDELGVHIVCADGEIQSVKEEGMADGTTFVVSNIFYNVPARMKFLKRDVTEASYITDLMSKFILSHPEISFRYVNSGKEIYFSAGDNVLKNCVYTVYGKDYAKGTIPVDYKKDGIQISGVCGKSDTVRPNRAYQSFFINKRYVKSPLISKAVEEAYKNQVMSGKYPMVILNISIDASLIDINVHPTKQEVKFSNEGDIFSGVFHALENALHSDYSIPEIEMVKEKPSHFVADIKKNDAQYTIEWEKQKHAWSPADEIKEVKKQEENQEKDFPDSYKCDVSNEYFEKRRQEILREPPRRGGIDVSLIREEPKTPDFQVPESMTPFADAISKAFKKEQAAKEEETAAIPEEIDGYKVIGQVFSTYIIVEKGDEMLIIDQHAAHERLKYEEIKKELEKKAVSAQDLLIPVTVDLTPVEKTGVFENEEFLNTLGFEIEDFGDNTVVVRTAPGYVDYEDIAQLLIELLGQILDNKEKAVSQKAEYAVYTIACKAAVKANKSFDIKELTALVEEIFKLGPVNTCPHGRPITISMKKKEIEKEFKRIL